MNYTQTQLENIADTFHSAGFKFDYITDNDTWAMIADCVLQGLGLFIQNEVDHTQQLEVLSNLMGSDTEKESFQMSYINLLALVLEDYETKYYPILGEQL